MKYNIIERYYDDGMIDIRVDYAGNIKHKKPKFSSCAFYDEWETTVENYINYLSQFKDEKNTVCDCTNIRPNCIECEKLLEIFSMVIFTSGINTSFLKYDMCITDCKNDRIILIKGGDK